MNNRQAEFEARLAISVAENRLDDRFVNSLYSYPPEQTVGFTMDDTHYTRLPPATGDEFLRRIEPHKGAWQIDPRVFKRDGRNCLIVPTVFTMHCLPQSE
jgi:hypothetical protein